MENDIRKNDNLGLRNEGRNKLDGESHLNILSEEQKNDVYAGASVKKIKNLTSGGNNIRENTITLKKNDLIDVSSLRQEGSVKDLIENQPLTRLRSQKTFRESQKIFINDNDSNKDFKNNQIDTSKYNIITFLPKALLYQFYRLANVYFVIIAILQSIPIISPLSRETAIAPIAFVLSVSLIREAIEDIIRHKFDDQTNNYFVRVYRENKLIQSTSETLRVGEIVVVKENETISADIVVLDTCLSGGLCHVETATLDGEKTLKTKSCPKELVNLLFNFKNENLEKNSQVNINSKKQENNLKKEESFHLNGLNAPDELSSSGFLECDKPNPNLYNFDGSIEVSISYSKSNVKLNPLPLDNNNILLKGSILKNTPGIVGIVVYTGHNTKLMLNSNKGSVKYSELEKLVSKILLFILALQGLFCLIAAILYQVYNKKFVLNNPYLPGDLYKYPVPSVINYFSYILLLNTMIPISLIITLEIVKIIQAYFMTNDCLGYSKERKQFIKVGSISLNEELGNVNFIFTDKTGTLTCNKMKFRNAIVSDKCFEAFQKESKTVSDNLLIEGLNKRSLFQNEKIKEYFTLLSLTHECNAEQFDNKVEYNGSSPDDVELVNVASFYGFTYLPSSTPGNRIIYRLNVGDFDNLTNMNTNSSYTISEKEYRIEVINEFSSQRKRMSIICFEIQQNQYIRLNSNSTTRLAEPDYYTVYIKGADSEIKKRLSKEYFDNNNQEKCYELNSCLKYIEHFATQGLRILMLGKKVISKEEYSIFSKKLKDANLNLKDKVESVNKVIDDFENGFELVGATVVEDKLQDEVPETITRLKQAGIKVWMLTGDSFDTAKKIGLSCSLLNENERIFEINCKKGYILSDFFNEFESYKSNKYASNENDHLKKNIKVDSYNQNNSGVYEIVVDRLALYNIFKSEETTFKFLEIASKAKSVVCCRVSPLQKAQIVKEMKKHDTNAKTLSIGDGGNDVSMILEANIGVGMFGEEGMRAVQASDYAIGEFKILQRLLFFHGRINLMRISKLIYYFFYKNFVFTIAHFFYLFWNNASGQSIFEDLFITFYNLIYTALPIGVLACSDFDIREEDGEIVKNINPYLYKESRDNPIFTKLGFILTMILGLFICLLQYLITVFGMGNNIAINDNGDIGDLWAISFTYYTSIYLFMTSSIILRLRYHTLIFYLIVIFLSFLPYLISIAYIHNSSSSNSRGSYIVILSSIRFYITIILSIGLGTMFELIIRSWEFLMTDRVTTILQSNREMLNNSEDAMKIQSIKQLINQEKNNHDKLE